MDTSRLKQFCVIAETGSMTKAAELLYLTHSALSKSMKVFQEELGLTLLRPAGRGLALTEDGIQTYQNAKQFLTLEAQLFGVNPKENLKTLRIGAVEVFLMARCGQLSNPQLSDYNFSFLELSPGQIEQLIVNKQLDFGITYAPFPMQAVEFTDVGKYSLGCYCLNDKFSGMDISKIPFAVPAQGLSNNPLGIKERDGWLESITPRNRKYSVNLLSTGLELVKQGLCAIFMPKFIAKLYPELSELPIPKPQQSTQRAFIVRHKDHTHDHIFKMLKSTLINIIKK